MTTTPGTVMAAQIGALIRRQPGVIAVYRPGRLIERAITATTDALTPGRNPEPQPIVAMRGDLTTVAVTIGIDSGSAADTCRAVHDRIAEWLSRHGHGNHEITVTIAYVRPQPSRG